MPHAPTDITEDALHDLLAKMAVLVAQFDRHCAQSREALQTSARQIPEQLRASSDQQMARLHTALAAQVGNAIEAPVARCTQRRTRWLHRRNGRAACTAVCCGRAPASQASPCSQS